LCLWESREKKRVLPFKEKEERSNQKTDIKRRKHDNKMLNNKAKVLCL
jgi:hypothetical protein